MIADIVSSYVNEGDSGMVGNDLLSPKIIGAEKNEAVGQMRVSKNCITFYSDNPEKSKDALASRICPKVQDNEVTFHIKG